MRWDGLWVCWKDYEERHPQDFVRGRRDDMRPAVVAGCCGSDGDSQLALSEAPLCPVLQEPLPGATVGGYTTVNLVFSTWVGIASYRVYLWEDGESQPTSPTYTVTGSPVFVTGLTSNTTYRWFVSAVSNGMERDCSGNVRTFSTPLEIPGCPSLTSPADGAEIEAEDLNPVSVTLSWGASTGATSYKVYLAIDGGALNLVATTASTSYELTDLEVGSSFVWLVRAANAAGESSGCGNRSFSVEPPAQIVTIYDTPGTYSYSGANPFATSVEVRVLGGGGGGGGGAVEAGASGITGGAGGGGAAGVVDTFDPSELVGAITVTVGAGGAGGAGGTSSGTHGGTDGSPGTASSFGALLIAGGGGGGCGGLSTGAAGRSSGGGGGGGVPNSGGAGTLTDGGTGGTTGGGAGGDGVDGSAASTDFGGSGGGGGSPSVSRTAGAASLWGGVGGASGGAGLNGAALQVGGNGTLSTGTALLSPPQGGAVVQVGPVYGNGQSGINPSNSQLLAGSSGAGGGGSPSSVDGANTGRGGAGGNGGRGSGGGGGGSAFSSLGSGGAGGTGGNGYVVIIETNG